jgi:hypothetical protein
MDTKQFPDKFSYNNFIIEAKVVDVHEGDLITITYFNNNVPIKLKLRMEGYYSPEWKLPALLKNRGMHVQIARISKYRLESLILNKIVKAIINEKNNEMYCKIYINEVCINDIIIEGGYGKPYSNYIHDKLYKDEDIIKITNSWEKDYSEYYLT